MSYVETPDGVRLRICDRGRGGHTFVLVHGWKQSHRLFDPAIARLCERHRVVAFDHRGMGESDSLAPATTSTSWRATWDSSSTRSASTT